jgi:hypothetical protein
MPATPRPELDPAWYDAVAVRISRRRYTGEPVPDEKLARLVELAGSFRPFPDVRVEFVRNPEGNLFTGYVGSYGSIRGAPTAIIFIGLEHSQTGIGYVGEALILEATRLGLGTCWVAGSYDRKRAAGVVHLEPGEKILSLTPVGIATDRVTGDERLMRTAVKADRRKAFDVFAPGIGDGSWPRWAIDAVECARLAPTGGNGQPQRFRYENGALVMSSILTPYWTAPIDFGICMLHVDLGAAHAGVRGTWEPFETPDVARFVPIADGD